MLVEDQTREIIQTLLTAERLPDGYIESAQQYFLPLASHISRLQEKRGGPLLVGLNGAQGTGKSTLSQLLKLLLDAAGQPCAVLSIDDIYLTRAERETLAENVHPLLITRGVPGTHDTQLGLSLIDQLKRADNDSDTAIPRFNKAIDDRWPASHWTIHHGRADIIILEGWCVGARPSPQPETTLFEPINQLEAEFDSDGRWRTAINAQLAADYQNLFAQIDLLVMLNAPSMECITRWRALQEKKLAENLLGKLRETEGSHGESSQKEAIAARYQGIMNEKALQRFMMHYERLTRLMLAELPKVADVVFDLDVAHQVIGAHYR